MSAQHTPGQLAVQSAMERAAQICEAQKRTLDPYNNMAAHIWEAAFDQCAKAIRDEASALGGSAS